MKYEINTRKEKLLYIDVCVIKIIAILMVVVAHYFRFFEPNSRLSGLKSIGFFGAALFAFISGYLAELNSEKVCVGGVLRKFDSVYLPYVITNLISVFIYKSWKCNLLQQIFMGTNDGVLWYVPFIMVFYVLFFIVAVNNWSRLILVFSGIIIFVLLELVGVESQWYTSIGALIFGVYAGKLKNKRKYIVGFTFLFLICTIATIKLENVLLLKDVFTAIAGIGFCGMVFNIVMLIPSRELENSKQVVTIASSSVYWTYLIHMKVGKVLENLIGSSLPLFLVISVLSAILLNECYRLFKRYLKQLWHHNL